MEFVNYVLMVIWSLGGFQYLNILADITKGILEAKVEGMGK